VTSKGLELVGVGKVDLSYAYNNEGQVTVRNYNVCLRFLRDAEQQDDGEWRDGDLPSGWFGQGL